MPAALFLIVAGFTLIYSALKGLSLPEIFAGNFGDKLDAKGGGVTTAPPTGIAAMDAASGADPEGRFKGPNAKTLSYIDSVLIDRFNLTRGQVCRPKDATYGAPKSLHKECRAGDYLGSVANRVAAARWAKENFPAAEVFCDQAGMVAPGYEHTSHLHIGM